MRWLAECNNQPQNKGIMNNYSTLTCIRDKPKTKKKYYGTVTCNRDCLKAKVGRIGQSWHYVYIFSCLYMQCIKE